ncbi:hypothetical protein PVAP13_1NG091144 [Panicum virgatum]|uniref:Uncharacterized protein n=1 Tax=Panicum virgatum TaxID=38727 RepID=A0A8T0WJL6_PANVG|nr:hypothetical protein PVAP13_1NG091144 [Panicum virgatum]
MIEEGRDAELHVKSSSSRISEPRDSIPGPPHVILTGPVQPIPRIEKSGGIFGSMHVHCKLQLARSFRNHYTTGAGFSWKQ